MSGYLTLKVTWVTKITHDYKDSSNKQKPTGLEPQHGWLFVCLFVAASVNTGRGEAAVSLSGS